MFLLQFDFLAANGGIDALKKFVTDQKLHPILVNFTAALVPVSIGTDIVARFLKKESVRATAWWTLFIAGCITPFTVLAGWLFWMDDDNGVTGMTIHKWLGTAMAFILVGLLLWRWRAFKKDQWPSAVYLLVGVIIVGAMMYQGHLGGEQSFGSMDSASENSSATSPSHDATNTVPMDRMPGMKMPASRPD